MRSRQLCTGHRDGHPMVPADERLDQEASVAAEPASAGPVLDGTSAPTGTQTPDGGVRNVLATVAALPSRLLVLLIRGYQVVISPMRGPTCRFYPSCSAYAVTALRTHGAIRGTAMAVWRLLRCNPWNPGGVDHVPPREKNSARTPRPEATTDRERMQ